jgi:hypothetical protein
VFSPFESPHRVAALRYPCPSLLCRLSSFLSACPLPSLLDEHALTESSAMQARFAGGKKLLSFFGLFLPARHGQSKERLLRPVCAIGVCVSCSWGCAVLLPCVCVSVTASPALTWQCDRLRSEAESERSSSSSDNPCLHGDLHWRCKRRLRRSCLVRLVAESAWAMRYC